MKHVLDVVNGTVLLPDRYEPRRSEVRKIFDRIIDYCERVGDALQNAGKQTERIQKAQQIAGTGLLEIFEAKRGLPYEFTVWVMPRRKEVETRWTSGVLPPAEDMFRVPRLVIFPPGDVRIQFHWEFFQGISQLDDLRRLRKCSGYLHDKPYYFLKKKVERQEHSFCSDQCRSDYNYKRMTEGKSQYGRSSSRKTKRK